MSGPGRYRYIVFTRPHVRLAIGSSEPVTFSAVITSVPSGADDPVVNVAAGQTVVPQS
jgi:hypothetical protein